MLQYWAVDTFSNKLRAKVKRGSVTWRFLVLARKFMLCLHSNPLNRYRWNANRATYYKTVEKIAKRAEDFLVVQIGACDGIMDDPIHDWIQKYAWSGILVEPQHDEFQRLAATYADNTKLHLENVAIASTSGLRTLYKISPDAIKEDWQRGTASLLPKPGLLELGLVATETIQCITLNDLMYKYAVKHVDMLQIDVEGYDFEIIKLIDFNLIKPSAICYEHRNLGFADRKACEHRLITAGYTLLRMQYDTAAIRRPFL